MRKIAARVLHHLASTSVGTRFRWSGTILHCLLGAALMMALVVFGDGSHNFKWAMGTMITLYAVFSPLAAWTCVRDLLRARGGDGETEAA